jgi:hypothetical protein
MQKEDDGKRSPGRGLRVAVVILAVISIAASAVAAIARKQLVDERGRAERLAAELSRSEDRVTELEHQKSGENEGNDPEPHPPADGDDNPFADDFGGDIGALLQCVGTDEAVSGKDTAEDARAQVREISSVVERLRRLHFEHRVKVKFLTPTAVAEKAARITLEDYPQKVADAEGRMLGSLGAIPVGTDLRLMTKKLIESQVAGFYVPSSDQLVVPGRPDRPLTPAQKVILAHELTHAVADGRLDFPLSEHPDPADLDEDLAALAVVEGDATLLMQRYAVTRLSVFDQLSMTSDPAYDASQEAIAKVPPYLVEQLTYPYVDGLNFTCELFAKGGWKAVNRAYAHPPTSTAQVLFPDRYKSGEGARNPTRPSPPSGRWKEIWHSTFGAANLLWLFKAPGGDEGAALSALDDRVAAWAGGTVDAWSRGRETSLALRLSERRGDDLCASVTEWYGATFDDDSETETRPSESAAWTGATQSAVVTCPKTEVRVGVGPNLTTARQVVR